MPISIEASKAPTPLREDALGRHVTTEPNLARQDSLPVYAVTPLQGSPLCPVPRPFRESSPHRLHYCILDSIDRPSHRESWAVDARRLPADNAILST